MLGYAQFPGGPVKTDGVVINTGVRHHGSATAPFNLGRTATHEVGHYFNLRHIWGDTPIARAATSSPTLPTPRSEFRQAEVPDVTCNNGPNGDMFMNYMDYTDDDSMFMFTSQQVARMRTTLDTARPGLK